MSSNSISRRAFIRGQVRSKSNGGWPPWAKPEFTEICSRCDDCIENCETGILVRGDGGFPQIDFSRGECTFCKACVDSCKDQAFTTDELPWNTIASATEGCLSTQGVMCRTCGDICPTRAISFRLAVGGFSTPEFNAQNCTGCGACIAPCPTNAITIQTPDQLPNHQERT